MKIKLVLIFSIVTAFSGLVLAQSDGDYVVPLTEYGQPDLQGVWNFSSNTPMQRPERFGEQEFLTSEQIQAAIARQEAVYKNDKRYLNLCPHLLLHEISPYLHQEPSKFLLKLDNSSETNTSFSCLLII
ncbi:MAG: hypothetical protein HQ498_06285, partial [Pseudohongiella sp.]|nr:hypothetical protein [Pseudohongiella sp.]